MVKQNFLTTLKSQFSSEYHLLHWIVFTFLGGCIYSAVVYFYKTIYDQISMQFPIPINSVATDPTRIYMEQQTILNLILPSVILFVSPLILSILLTKLTPEKRIIPPLFIQIIAYGWFIIYFVNPTTFNNIFLAVVMLGVYTYITGLIQDKIIVSVFGLSGAKNMDRFSIKTNSKLSVLKNRLLQEKYLKSLELSRKYADVENGFRLHSTRDDSLVTIIEIIQEDPKIEECLINIIVLERKKYDVYANENTKEHLNHQVDIINGILFREKLKYEDADPANAEYLVTEASNAMSGISKKVERLSSLSWIKVGAFLAILALIGFLFYQKGSTEGVVGVVVMFLLYIVYETKDYRKRKE